jgi:hypothetical protein
VRHHAGVHNNTQGKTNADRDCEAVQFSQRLLARRLKSERAAEMKVDKLLSGEDRKRRPVELRA